MVESTTTQTSRTAADRAARRTMLERRRRVWRNVVLFVVVTTVMVLLSMAQRDHQSVSACRERLGYTCQKLQTLLEHGVAAPQRLPLPVPGAEDEVGTEANGSPDDEAYFKMRAHYFYNARYGRESARGRRVGVCCCDQPHRLYLRADGRHIVVFDGQRYELIWVPETEFPRQAEALGLRLPEGR